jgi:hypothetical protein
VSAMGPLRYATACAPEPPASVRARQRRAACAFIAGSR